MEAIIDITRVIEGIPAGAAVTAADIKVAVRAEMEVAAVMVTCRIELGDQRLLRVDVHSERLQAGNLKAGNPLMELTFNPKTIIDKDLLGFGDPGMDSETQETALAGGIKLAVLRVDLEDLRFSELPGVQTGHHLDFAAEVGASLLLLIGRRLVSLRGRNGVALLEDEDDVLASGHRGDRDGETEGQTGEGLVQSDRILGERGGRPEREGEQESEERMGTHEGRSVRTL